MTCFKKIFLLAALCLTLISTGAQARDLVVSLPMLPPLVSSKESGILVELVKAMAEEYKDGKITWDIYPFAKSIDNVAKGKADFHLPLIVNDNIKPSRLPFQYSSEKIFNVVFVLYTNKKNTEINAQNAGNYKIETDMGHKNYFGFKVTGSSDIETSLRKVDSGAIDGWLFAMPESDLALKKLGLKNINRTLFKKYDVRIVLPKGEKGKEVDKILSDLIGKLKTSGKYQKIMAPILDEKFEN